jgi:hypothetical protein
MADTVRIIEYFYAQVGDTPGSGRRLLEHLSERGVNLIAFTAFPIGSGQTQLDFVPENASELRKAATDAGIALFGPKRAFLFQGDDRVGALHQHHLTLANAGINVHAANGTVDGAGRFGFILWVPQEQFERAAAALEI